MTVILLTSTGSGTWLVPDDCPVGTQINVETWGGGCGANGQTSTSFGAGGGGGAYAASPSYVVTPNDDVNGIAYTIGVGTAGGTGANPSAGGLTSWSTNNLNVIRSTNMLGAVSGTPGTLPTGYMWSNATGTTTSVVGSGIATNGMPYLDFSVTGTATSTGKVFLFFDLNTAITCAPVTVAAYTLSIYIALLSSTLTNILVPVVQADGDTSAVSWVSTPFTITPTLTSTLTQFNQTATFPATSALSHIYFTMPVVSGSAYNSTFRIAAPQLELGSSVTSFKSTPGYTRAAGGGAPSGNTAGPGGTTAASVGTTLFAGGAGAAYSTSGSGGGGSGGKDGIGGTATTGGGRGDGTVGGLGGAVKTTNPGNPGTANVEGGGGGGGLRTVAGTGGAGGAPGGGGGGSAVASGTGGAGARGQIRLTYNSQLIPGIPYARESAIQIWDH